MAVQLKITFCSFLLCLFSGIHSQETKPINGIADNRNFVYAFTNATIVKNVQETVYNATLVIKDGKIASIGKDIAIPKEAVVFDCKGKYIYPSFIDLFSDYGMPVPAPQNFFTGNRGMQESKVPASTGPVGSNSNIKSEFNAVDVFAVNNTQAQVLRASGFGTVLSHKKEGIAEGTGTLVSLTGRSENFAVIKPIASAHYSFSGMDTKDDYPESLMGKIALLRQTFLDAGWYKTNPISEGTNLSLEAWNRNQKLPQIFEAGAKWNDLRADKIGDEFGVQFIIKAGIDEFERIEEIKKTNAFYIIPINFPGLAMPKEPTAIKRMELGLLKKWELAPGNPAQFEKEKIPFCITSQGTNSASQFMQNLRKAILYGLSETKAFEALTKAPAEAIGVYDVVGSLDAGKLANFIVASGPVFNEKAEIYENWVQGILYKIKDPTDEKYMGLYQLTIHAKTGKELYTLEVKEKNGVTMYAKDTLDATLRIAEKNIELSYGKKMPKPLKEIPKKEVGDTSKNKLEKLPEPPKQIKLTGFVAGKEWNGYGIDTAGNIITWAATYLKPLETKDNEKSKTDSAAINKKPELGELYFPNEGYGYLAKDKPRQENILLKNATVWTNEKEGVLQNADVLLKNGKIAAIGKNISDPAAKTIDATGKHVTPGIIDEHSHIAASSALNEGTQSVTAEVRISDVIDPEDVDIYRQLAGGVTTSHILHGSANTIGGQTQLIKLRWGLNAEEMKFKGWTGQIKFALGENVKGHGIIGKETRYPVTRMGVEQVLTDAFTRAKAYQKKWQEYNLLNEKQKAATPKPRQDLELDALVEILEKKRFITCHSYVQSEILNTMQVAEKMGFRINTFTHILEGYKVAEQMKAHGAFASTFSDWWAYKFEVQDAIPYNAAILQKVGLVVSINSDDAEMARRLNQEAAKAVKYGGVTEEEALKMVTLNPAKMLHVEDKVGSLKIGKDADVVIWSNHPLSIYAKPLYTIVDGAIYFDSEKNKLIEAKIVEERKRLLKKLELSGDNNASPSFRQKSASFEHIHLCEDDETEN